MDDGACAPRCLLQEQEKHKELACALSRWVKTSTRCARPCAASRTPKSRRAPKRATTTTPSRRTCGPSSARWGCSGRRCPASSEAARDRRRVGEGQGGSVRVKDG